MALAPPATVTLSDVLREERDAVGILTQQLRVEYELLKVHDAVGIEDIAQQKRETILQLQSHITARKNYLLSRRFPPDLRGLLACIAAAPPDQQEALNGLALALFDATQEARAQNEINGVVISASRGHVEQALAILSGRDPADCLYDQETRKVFSTSRMSIAKV